ncbi:asparagine synthase (glutamine-hydrolyzing) [Risungbinella massiliensis]|uniref:asparagine synthase (glutamine-hydrolyzing) n=1 Tax=Risungbinella massiliensis TaxID=1329796 RepID=UPI0005CC0A79|nr:asparagine synthase (glutamine-hydrolyzing) [Risungbinella massiliensis]
MCGITGWVDYERDLSLQVKQLEAMNEKHSVRGPDAEGKWISRHALLGHRRLAVIDLETGAQPMIKQLGGQRYIITFNGEIYNMAELRSRLKTLGYRIETTSDTELILLAYAEWGTEAPQYLNGIFAFAIWDEQKEELFIARDRIGVKPLFYSRIGSSLLFGSEIKSLLAHPMVKAEIDDIGISEILVMGPARTPGVGIFRNIQELKPGCQLFACREGIRIQPYWELQSKTHEDDFPTTVEQVRDLFQDAVRRQLISDVPIGTFLSGGLDSSGISAFAAKAFEEEGRGVLTTFSVDYQDNDKHFQKNEFQPNADAPWIRVMAEAIGSDHHDVVLDNEELFESIEAAMIARDLPGMADIDASLLLFSREIKKHLTVALSGECADELFGGYPWFHREELLHADTFPWAAMVDKRVPFIRKDVQKRIDPLSYVQDRYQEALAEVPRFADDTLEEARMREMFYLNITRWMPTLLDRKDRMTMAYGLEVRVPYCDQNLVDYVWNVPWSMKFHGKREKGLLREALKDLLPKEVMQRKKSPYPKTHHPDYLRKMKAKVEGFLVDSEAPLFELIDRKQVAAFLEQDLGKVHLPWFGQLMNVPAMLAYWVQLNEWLKKYQVNII